MSSSNKLLFENNFIQNLDTIELPNAQKEAFRKHIEAKRIKQKQDTLLAKKNENKQHNNGKIIATDYNRVSYTNTNTNDGRVNTDYSLNENVGYTPFNSTNVLPNTFIKPKIIKTERKYVVDVHSSDRDTSKYPNQNDFTVYLGKTFHNVKSIELVSSEIPNSAYTIVDEPYQLQNNIITWQNEEDIDLNFFYDLVISTSLSDTIDITLLGHGKVVGSSINIKIFNSKLDSDPDITGVVDGEYTFTVISDSVFRMNYTGGLPEQGIANINLGYPKYTITLTPGNYTATTLVNEIAYQAGLLRRRNGTGQFHYFEVVVNNDTDQITIDSVILTQLPANPISVQSGLTTITVNQRGHGFKTGDRVKMVGVKLVGGIPSTTLNGDFIVDVIDFNTFTYEVIVRANETADGGGSTVKTGKDAPFRLLFDTENTRIQDNTGFPDEDSSEYINSIDPITTKVLSIIDAQKFGLNKIRFTTSNDHLLDPCNIVNIVSISTGSNPLAQTSTPHGLELPTRVIIRGVNCKPRIDGTCLVIPNGPFHFNIQNKRITTAGTSGELLYGGDKVDIKGLTTVPNIESQLSFFVENVNSSSSFDITFFTDSIDTLSIQDCVVQTSQIFVNHPNHSFNNLTSIESVGADLVSIKTQNTNNFIGSRINNVNIIDDLLNTNSIILEYPKHGLSTSDTIKVINSTSTITIDGIYKVQVIDLDNLRINVTHSGLIPGTCTVISGETVTLNYTKSLPKLDGTWNIHNREFISNISLGINETSITTSFQHNWKIGDTLTITGTDSTPDINGSWVITDIVDPSTFKIELPFDIVSPGTTGIIVNRSRFIIKTDFLLTTEVTDGTSGIIGRDTNVLHYRIKSEAEGIDTLGGISLKVLNGIQRKIEKIIDNDNYMIRVDENFATHSATGGGNSVRVSSLKHGLRSIQANTGTGDTTGSRWRSISLEGEPYIYLVSEGLDCVINNAGITNVFAKILLNELPGYMIYNSFVSAPKVFENPIAVLDTLRFQMVNRKGYAYNFNDLEYSFSLYVTEIVEKTENSAKSSRKNNF